MLTQVNLPQKKVVHDRNYTDISCFDMLNASLKGGCGIQVSSNFNLEFAEILRVKLLKPVFETDYKDQSYFAENNSYIITKKAGLFSAQSEYCISQIYKLILPYHPDTHIITDSNNNYYVAYKEVKYSYSSRYGVNSFLPDKVCGLATIVTLAYVFGVDVADTEFQNYYVDENKSAIDFIMPFKIGNHYHAFFMGNLQEDKISNNIDELVDEIIKLNIDEFPNTDNINDDTRSEIISALRKILNHKEEILKIINDNLNGDPTDIFEYTYNQVEKRLKENPEDVELKEEFEYMKSNFQANKAEIMRDYTTEAVIKTLTERFDEIEKSLNHKMSLNTTRFIP